MRRWIVALTFAQALFLSSAAASQDKPEAVSDGAAFHIDLPEGAVLTRRIIVDFGIYEVAVAEKPIVGFYEGFAADVGEWVSNRRLPERQHREQPNGAADFFWSRRCMPTEVHGWLMPNLSATEVTRARSIIEFLEMKPC